MLLLMLSQGQANFTAIIGAAMTVCVAVVGAYVRLKSNQEKLYVKQTELSTAQARLTLLQGDGVELVNKQERIDLIEKLETRNAGLQNQLDAQGTDLGQLKLRVNRLEQELLLTKDRNVALTADNTHLHNELTTAKTEITRLQERVDVLEQENQQLRARLGMAPT